MDGKTLIHRIPQEAFKELQFGDSDFTLPKYHEGLTLQMLAGLYEADAPFDDNIESLTESADISLFVYRGVKSAMEKEKRQRPQFTKVGKNGVVVNHVNLDSPGARRIDDATSTLTSEEMLPTSHAGVDSMREIGATFSNLLLASTINQVVGASDRIDRGKSNLSKEVGQALRQRRQDFVRQFNRFGSTTTITRTHTVKGQLLTTESVSKSWTTLNHVPEWLQGQDHWDEALHMICAHFTELDAFVAAYEWIIDRQLPVVPILAPTAVDKEIYELEDGKLNSDILLLNLANNEIIPVQAKTRATRDKRDIYSDEVILVDPQELGLVDIETALVKVDGRVSTGKKSKTYHGALMTEFMQSYAPKKNGRKSQNDRLKTAFQFFDRAVLPRLQIEEPTPAT